MLHTDTGQRKKYVTSAEFMLMLSFACRDGFHCPFIPTKEKKKIKPNQQLTTTYLLLIPELIDKSGVDLGEKPRGTPRPHG